MSIRNPVSCEYEAFLRITGIVKSELQDLSEFPDIVLPRAPEVQPDALVGQGKARDLGRRIREVRMSTYLCAGIRVSFSLSISRYCLSLPPAMLRHSRRAGRRAGDFHAKISGQDMPVKTQGAGLYESGQDFSLFLLFSFFEMPFRVFIFCG